jgi:hypothetical protein
MTYAEKTPQISSNLESESPYGVMEVADVTSIKSNTEESSSNIISSIVETNNNVAIQDAEGDEDLDYSDEKFEDVYEDDFQD